MGSEDGDGQEGQDLIDWFGPDGSTIAWGDTLFGSWESNFNSDATKDFFVAFKFGQEDGDFHLFSMGALTDSSEGWWETDADTTVSVADIVVNNGALECVSCGGLAELSNVTYWYAMEEDPDPGPVVPIPAAAWLFGSALLGFMGYARRRRSTDA